MSRAKVLFVDIETAPIIGYVWDIWDQTLGLNQIKSDWHLLSWSAKWSDSKKVMYMDQRNEKNIEDDSRILKEIWKLLDQADVIVTQNGKRFDVKKLNARFVEHGMQPPSSYRHIDVLQVTRKKFAFTSHKLEHMTKLLCKKYKKLAHKKFPGFELWKACLAGNKAAWKEMRRYNIYDVLSLEELYDKVKNWDTSINFSVYEDKNFNVCSCGSKSMRNKGYIYTNMGKYTRYKCTKCGAETRGRVNLFSKEKKKSLRSGT